MRHTTADRDKVGDRRLFTTQIHRWPRRPPATNSSKSSRYRRVPIVIQPRSYFLYYYFPGIVSIGYRFVRRTMPCLFLRDLPFCDRVSARRLLGPRGARFYTCSVHQPHRYSTLLYCNYCILLAILCNSRFFLVHCQAKLDKKPDLLRWPSWCQLDPRLSVCFKLKIVYFFIL